MQRRTCEHCGTGFEARSSRARFCSDRCRIREHRGSPKAAPAPVQAAVTAAVQVPTMDLRQSVAAALAESGRLGTPMGVACLLLAEQAMDADARALPALTRELSARLAEALAGAKSAVSNPADELRERRERRGVA